jgi:hypothetical protein
MSKIAIHKRKRKAVRRRDLTELVLAPILSQLNAVGVHILERLNEVQETTDLIARELKRQIEKR